MFRNLVVFCQRSFDHLGNEKGELEARDYGDMLSWGYGNSGNSGNTYPRKRAPVLVGKYNNLFRYSLVCEYVYFEIEDNKIIIGRL